MKLCALLLFVFMRLAFAQPGGAFAACAACHGQQGEGNATGTPRLAGQSAPYLVRQLQLYASSARPQAIMTPQAAALNPQQMAAAAAYFAALPGAASPPIRGNDAVIKRGETLATRGDAALGVQACANCHGPGGIGSGPLYPMLAGQQQSYLVNTLRAFQGGARATDPSLQMSMIAKRLGPAEIEAVAAYYAQLPPPRAQGQAGP